MDSLPNVDTRNYGSPTLRFEDDILENDRLRRQLVGVTLQKYYYHSQQEGISL